MILSPMHQKETYKKLNRK